jgi:alkyl hydroperoxide reductase subunit AhpC
LFGISGDSTDRQRAFADSERLNFPLLADIGHGIASKYGAVSPDGKPLRVTVLIGPSGDVIAIDREVNSQFSSKDGKLVSSHGRLISAFLSDWNSEVGSKLPDLLLVDRDNNPFTVRTEPFPLTVILRASSGDPLAKEIATEVDMIAGRTVYQRIQFVCLADDPKELAHLARVSVLHDATGVVRNRFAGSRTIWIADRNGLILAKAVLGSDQNLARKLLTLLDQPLRKSRM